MHPILFRIGSVPFYTYTAAIYIGALGALGLMLGQAPKRGLSPQSVLGAYLWALAGAILAGRIAHVALNWAAYSAQPAAIWRSWGEGLSWPGALLGGLAGLAAYAARRGERFWALADLGALGLALALVWGWLGALMHGAGYGRAAYAGWAWELPDLHGIVLPRFPTQAVALIASAGILGALWAARGRLRPGGSLALFLALHGLALAALQPTRGDASAAGPAQALYLAEAGAALVIWFAARVTHARRPGLAEGEYPLSEGS